MSDDKLDRGSPYNMRIGIHDPAGLVIGRNPWRNGEEHGLPRSAPRPSR